MKEENKKRLLSRPSEICPETLDYLLLCIAATIEDSILDNPAAIPGKDYTILDLYKLAAPFALHVFKKDKTGFTNCWIEY